MICIFRFMLDMQEKKVSDINRMMWAKASARKMLIIVN